MTAAPRGQLIIIVTATRWPDTDSKTGYCPRFLLQKSQPFPKHKDQFSRPSYSSKLYSSLKKKKKNLSWSIVGRQSPKNMMKAPSLLWNIFTTTDGPGDSNSYTTPPPTTPPLKFVTDGTLVNQNIGNLTATASLPLFVNYSSKILFPPSILLVSHVDWHPQLSLYHSSWT